MKTGRWGGVVITFITMSNIKDEIDWEFPSANTTTGQANYFWQGNIRGFFLSAMLLCGTHAHDQSQPTGFKVFEGIDP